MGWPLNIVCCFGFWRKYCLSATLIFFLHTPTNSQCTKHARFNIPVAKRCTISFINLLVSFCIFHTKMIKMRMGFRRTGVGMGSWRKALNSRLPLHLCQMLILAPIDHPCPMRLSPIWRMLPTALTGQVFFPPGDGMPRLLNSAAIPLTVCQPDTILIFLTAFAEKWHNQLNCS